MLGFSLQKVLDVSIPHIYIGERLHTQTLRHLPAQEEETPTPLCIAPNLLCIA